MAWIRRHPVAAFLAWFFPVGWAIALIPLIAKNTLGVEWGGNWTSIVDAPHYQLATGLSLAAARDRFETGQALV